MVPLKGGIMAQTAPKVIGGILIILALIALAVLLIGPSDDTTSQNLKQNVPAGSSTTNDADTVKARNGNNGDTQPTSDGTGAGNSLLGPTAPY